MERKKVTMNRLAAILCLALPGISCGDHASAPVAMPNPVAPSPTAATAPSSPANGSLFVKGTVSDTAFRYISGVKVEVLDGPQAGMSTTSSASGGFSLTGIFDDATRFRATKDGYVTATRTMQPFCAPCNPNRWISFSLEVPAEPANMAGDYTLTFVADSACVALPNELRTRTYNATIPPASNGSPANFVIIVDGALSDWNVLDMGLSGDYVAIWLETLVEQIAPNTSLSFGGLAAAAIGTSAQSTIALTFDGSIDYKVSATHAQCTSKNHQLILTRR